MSYEFWFAAGSQFLYGSEVPETVEARPKKMAAKRINGLAWKLK